MDALKITFNLAEDMVYPAMPLHLDALLAYAVTQSDMITLGENATHDELLALADDLPFERHEQDGEWVYKASALMPVGSMTHSRLFHTQRYDLDKMVTLMKERKVKSSVKSFNDMEPNQIKLDTTRGAQRNLLGYYSVTAVPAMVAYCIGNKDVIAEYLIDSGYITHLGSRRRQGLGAIASIDIEVDSEAKEMWKKRVKPFAIDNDDTPIIATCKPPYWDKSMKMDAFIPSTLI